MCKLLFLVAQESIYGKKAVSDGYLLQANKAADPQKGFMHRQKLHFLPWNKIHADTTRIEINNASRRCCRRSYTSLFSFLSL